LWGCQAQNPLFLNPTAAKILFAATTLNQHDNSTKRLKRPPAVRAGMAGLKAAKNHQPIISQY
jgi:hypothetical protein